MLATEGVQKAMDELGPLKNSKGEDITADSIIKAAKLHSKTAKHDIEITRN